MQKHFLVTIIIILCALLCGCSDKSVGTDSEYTSEEVYYSLQNDVTDENINIADGDNNETFDLSYNDLMVEYSGESFTKSVFAVGGNVIYICGIYDDGNYFLAMMNKEDDNLTYVPYEFPDSMRLLRMSVDLNECCHMLWISTEKVTIGENSFDSLSFDECLIICIDKDGLILSSTDISSVFDEEQFNPFCFVADGNGNYYMENNNEIIKVGTDGSIEKYNCEGAVEGIGMAYDGKVYLTYSLGEEIRLAYIYGNEIHDCNIVLNKSEANYSYISPAQDADILLYNKSNGVYAYDYNDNIVTQRVSSDAIPLDGQEIAGYGIMGDERLCLLEQSEQVTRFYYIPCAE